MKLLRQAGTAFLVLAVVFGVYQLAAGAIESGITTDEPAHYSRTSGWIDYGWYLPSDQLTADGDPVAFTVEDERTESPYVYGPAFSGMAHAVNWIAGNEARDTVSNSASAWQVRHLISALIGGLAAFACGGVVWLLTRSWRFGLWTVAALLAIPLWSGMSFFNPKDIPAAAGYTFVTVGLLLALAWPGGSGPSRSAGGRGPGSRLFRSPWVKGFVVAALVAGGIFLGVGTRIAFWVPTLLSIGTFAGLAIARGLLGITPRSEIRQQLLAPALGLVAGTGALLATYPKVFGDPLTMLSQSIDGSAEFPWQGVTLTAGQLLSENPPWWYLPVWGFASTPVLILLLAVAGAAVVVRRLLAARNEGAGASGAAALLRAVLARPEASLLLVFQQLLLLPVGSMIVGATMYTGLRQHLYVLPPLAILAGLGAFALWTRVAAGTARVAVRVAVAAMLGLALLVPLAEQRILFPYNYVYVNPVAGIGGVNDRWEGEYWWSSGREARTRVPAGVELFCLDPVAAAYPESAQPPRPCPDEQYYPFSGERPEIPVGPEGWTLGRIRSASVIPDGCREAGSVTRWLRGEELVMSYVLDCDIARDQDPASGKRQKPNT